MHVYTASQLTPLLAHFATTMAESPLPPRDAELVVVQSQGMRRWITLQLADRFGCAASLQLPFPAAFVRDMERRTNGVAATAPERERFTREVLTWRVDALLRSLPNDADCAPLHRYLRDADERARFGLAAQLASRFDDYQLFRADVLAAWEAGDDPIGNGHSVWQCALWQRLCEAPTVVGQAAHDAEALRATRVRASRAHAGHLAARLEHTVAAIRSGKVRALPTRVTVFGVSALPPAFLDLLAALADVRPVTVYTATLHSAAHPLAQALGAQGREFLHLLRERGATVTTLESEPRASAVVALRAELPAERPVESPTESPAASPATLPAELPVELPAGATTVLHTLQQELVAGVGAAALSIAPGDRSLSVHDAHGPIRQLEVLRDQLLAALDANPQLRPHDLLLLVPDATEWAPLVDAVFGAHAGDGAPLPYRIADRPTRRTQPAMEAFARLLALEGGRLARSEVLSLLALPLARQGAQLTESDRDALELLTERANVRWGYDADARATLGLPAYEAASWRAGLDRVLLGSMVGRTPEPVLGVLPEAGDTSGDPELVARLARWVDALAHTLGRWREPRTLHEWSEAFVQATNLLFDADTPVEQQSLEGLRLAFQRLRGVGELAGYTEHVPFGVVRDWLEQLLDDDGQGAGFLMGGMTVAALKPMRSLPFRVIAVAGLDDGVFPRRDRRAAFDLLELERRAGDRDLRSDDRQLFLDLLLAAQDQLILSFNGRAVRDNSPCAPSVVVDELLDYLDRRTAGTARGRLVVSHPLQPFAQAYFTGDASDAGDGDEEGREGDARDDNAHTPRTPPLFSYSHVYANAARAQAERDERTARGTSRPDLPPAAKPAAKPAASARANSSASARERERAAVAPIATITLDELTSCWSNPSRYYCLNALHLSLTSDIETLPDDEPIALDALQEGMVRARMLRASLERTELDRDDALLRTRLSAEGLLPLEELGAAWYERLGRDVQAVLDGIPRVTPHSARIAAHGEGWQLAGRLDQLRGVTRIVARAGSVRPEHRIRTWVEHVAMCAAHAQGNDEVVTKTWLVGKQSTKRYKTDLDLPRVANAPVLLEALVRTALRARTEPIPFFPQAGWAWFDAMRPDRARPSTTTPFEAAQRAYHLESNQYSPMGGDHTDPYVAFCFRDIDPMRALLPEFERLTRQLFAGWPSPEGAS